MRLDKPTAGLPWNCTDKNSTERSDFATSQKAKSLGKRMHQHLSAINFRLDFMNLSPADRQWIEYFVSEGTVSEGSVSERQRGKRLVAETGADGDLVTALGATAVEDGGARLGLHTG
jgi:hypothetical protein